MHVHASIAKTVGAAEGKRVIEIGSGLGTLTAHLLETGADVWAIERDRDLCEVLRKEFGALQNFTLHEADAVKFDYAAAADGESRPHIAGNLPYHLTGPLLFRMLEAQAVTGPWVILIQKEVAQRIVENDRDVRRDDASAFAGIGSSASGRLRSHRGAATQKEGGLTHR